MERFQPRLLSRMGKKAPLTVERKHRQGGFASEQTPHSSSCPPLAADRPRPFRCSSFSHTNRFAGFAWEPCPFAIPLKTTKEEVIPLPWNHPPPNIGDGGIFVQWLSFCLCRGRCPQRPDKNYELAADFRKTTYSAGSMWASTPTTLNRTSVVRIPYVKYLTGANKTTHTAYRALRKPNQTAARRAFLTGRTIGEWHTETKCLFCA